MSATSLGQFCKFILLLIYRKRTTSLHIEFIFICNIIERRDISYMSLHVRQWWRRYDCAANLRITHSILITERFRNSYQLSTKLLSTLLRQALYKSGILSTRQKGTINGKRQI